MVACKIALERAVRLDVSSANFSAKSPWVASACADCPGFLVLGAPPAPASTLVSEPQIVPLGWHFALRALGHCLDLLPAAPPPPVQKRDAQHKFLQHRGARAEFNFSAKFHFLRWPQLGPFFVPACPPLTAINGY